MSLYRHLTLKDREIILVGPSLKHSFQKTATRIGCSKSTISREVKRNGGREDYSAVQAQENHQRWRLKSHRIRILADPALRDFVVKRITDYHWSPEQIRADYLTRIVVGPSATAQFIVELNVIILVSHSKAMGHVELRVSCGTEGKHVKLKERSMNVVGALTTLLQFTTDNYQLRNAVGLDTGKMTQCVEKPGVLR